MLRGVNLGGWLVLERWMTPSLFRGMDARDEYTFMQTPGAAEKIRAHRDNFITESDFAWLEQNGINAIRLPIGYWIIEPDGPYEQGIEYVDWAFAMAEKYSLQVLLDLHGAPGSQNGYNHSGKIGRAEWFSRHEYRDRTRQVLKSLHERYKNNPQYWGLQLLNEPKFGVFRPALKRFYQATASDIDGKQKIVFHDAFMPRLMSGALRRDPRAVMDVHLYHMTSVRARIQSVTRFVDTTENRVGRLLSRVSKKQDVIIGEWSAVLRGESVSHLDKTARTELMERYARAQLAAYETHAIGWFYWSYKTEKPGPWSYRASVASELLPRASLR